MLITQVARVGVLTTVSFVSSAVFNTIGGTFGTIKKSAITAKNITIRKVDYADKKSASIHQRELMTLKADNREHMIAYGERTAEQRKRWEDLEPKIQDDLINWEARLPDI
jgi:hypothetical protein